MSSIHDRLFKDKGKPIVDAGVRQIVWEAGGEHLRAVIPAEQAWLWYTLDQQTKLLDRINSKLAFIVLIIIVAIILSFFSALLGI
jgi:hypothetical protein